MNFLLSLSLKVKIIIISCIAAAAAVTAVALVMNSEDAYRVIKVFEIEGSAVVTRENTGELDAYEGMNLESGDVLSVGADSYMRISLDGDKYILLDSGTVLELIASGSAKDSRTAVNLKEGTILNEITNALSANSSYEVNTPKATMAVRGTSFKVTVVKTDDGGYVTDIDTIHGEVLVRLYDESGNFKDAEALITEGNRVTILTDPNEETGNAPELDGNAYFVFRSNGGGLVPCGDDDPVYPSDYSAFSEVVRKEALNSNDSRLLPLNKEIADRLRGNDTDVGEAETAASEATSELTSESKTETRFETSKTFDTDTSASRPKPIETAAYLPAENVGTATAVPQEKDEPTPVIPSELTSVPEAESPITETSITASAVIADTEKTAWETTVQTKNTSAKTTVTERYIYTYVPTVPGTSVPTAGTPSVTSDTEIITSSEAPSASDTAESSVPSGTAPITETSEGIASGEITTAATDTEPSTETEPEPQPTVYSVSFIDADGNTVLTSEIEDGEKLGTLPALTEKKGYTAKWIGGGEDVTADTIISADMEITAEYAPRPVTVRIYAPYGSNPGDTYDVIRTFTVLYDGRFTDNAESLTVDSLTEYVDGRYSEYFEEWGRDYVLDGVTFGGDGGAVTDGTMISGDNVYAEDGVLCTDIYFVYTQIS